MKKLFGLFFTISLFSCSNDEPQSQAVEWQVIKLENEVVVYGFYGSLDDYLIVSTIGKILRTTDKGATWTTVLNTQESIANFININGTLYAISNFKDYSSIDNGLTWTEESFDWEVSSTPDQVSDSRGILYHRVSHFEGELVLPSTVLCSSNRGSSWKDIFPHQRALGAMYMDEHDRLYLSASGYVWNNQQGFFTPEQDSPAYIYYNKR